jgi:hypothetical protein
MPKELVLHDGQLAEKIVTESYQVIELGQLEAEVNANQATVDQARNEAAAANARVAEAEVALEDSKSNFETGKVVVAQLTNSGAEEPAENAASEPTEDSVAQPNTDF